MKNNEMIVFEDGELKLEVSVNPEEDTVWLSQQQLSDLFNTSRTNVIEHIKNIYDEQELDEKTTCQNFRQVRLEGKRKVGRNIPFYNLDLIISLGYRVKSKRAIRFRKWATHVLKEYMIQGYALNDKKLKALNQTVTLQSNIISGMLGLESQDVLKVIHEYSHALEALDNYDHQNIKKPEGNHCIYQLSYRECRELIEKMSFFGKSFVFGIEKEVGKVEGILYAVFQEVFDKEVYPSLEEKAANLLYFIIKDHPFVDGCKRIAATLFLHFLNQNQALYHSDKTKIISDSALVAITLMIAQSNPKEKEIMIALVMNFLTIKKT